MKNRDGPIMAFLIAFGFAIGAVVGWQVGWRYGAVHQRDSLLCLTADMSGDHLADETVKYCGRIRSPIAKDVAHNAEPHSKDVQ